MYVYICTHMSMPALALGHLRRDEAAGHQIVPLGHSAWARWRDVALPLGVCSRVVADSPG